MQLRVKRLRPGALVPTRTFTNDSGFDLYSCESFSIGAGCGLTVRTGIAIELPQGTEGQIRARSGLALKYGVTVLNSPGTIDEGYRGEIKVILFNHGRAPFVGQSGVRVAQLVVQRRLSVDLVEVESLTNSDRGKRGFGSTGD